MTHHIIALSTIPRSTFPVAGRIQPEPPQHLPDRSTYLTIALSHALARQPPLQTASHRPPPQAPTNSHSAYRFDRLFFHFGRVPPPRSPLYP